MGNMSNIQRVFTKYDNSTIIERKNLLEGLRRCMICMGGEKQRYCQAGFRGRQIADFDQFSYLQLSGGNQPGSAVDSPVSIGFNGIYLTECLKSFECENVEVTLGTSVQPMTVDAGDLSALILPLRTA
jgi:DNA polymerase III sliding clamp (beta) subunit (PCNA family)